MVMVSLKILNNVMTVTPTIAICVAIHVSPLVVMETLMVANNVIFEKTMD